MVPAHCKLRESTREAHVALEAAARVSTADFDLHKYREFLEVMYRCHWPVEERLAASAAYVEAVPNVQGRRRAELAALDLEDLGHKRPKLSAERSAMPKMGTLAEQLGVAYVFEGATLGGQVLVRSLTGRHGVARSATRYLAGYGSVTGKRWREFTCVLNERVCKTEEVDSAVRSATATFKYLLKGFERHNEAERQGGAT